LVADRDGQVAGERWARGGVCMTWLTLARRRRDDERVVSGRLIGTLHRPTHKPGDDMIY